MTILLLIVGLFTWQTLAVAQGPTNLRIVGTTPTQGIVEYDAPDDEPCRVEASLVESFDPLINDVNPALFPGADTDQRAIRDGRHRTLVIGQRKAEPGTNGRMYSRALQTATAHALRITCTGGDGTIVFFTTSTAGLAPEPPPFHATADGNFGVPDFDWSDRSKPVIDPQTGLAIYRIGDPRDFASNSQHSFAPGIFFNGVGWTSTSNVTSGTTSSLASTGSTQPLFLPIDSTLALTWGGWNNTATQGHPVTDLAIRVFGNATHADSDNRKISICLSVNSGQTCHTNSLEVVLPTGSATDVGLLPASYPNPIFAAWGKTITRDFFSSQGSVTVNGNEVNLTKDKNGSPINANSQSAASRFHLEWAPGAKLYIANSSPACANNYCTIAAVISQTRLTIQEGLTLPENTYRFAGLGFRIHKTTDVGTVRLSANYRVAKSFILHQGANSGCSTTPVGTTVDRNGAELGRTIVGRLCIFPWMFESSGRLYFVGESEPEARLLALIKQPASIPGHIEADLPNAPAELAGPNAATFQEDNPNVFFTGIKTRGGSNAIFKLTYKGDYRENKAAFWSSSPDSTPATGTANLEWENTTRSAQNKDLRSQILNKSTYNEAQWGPLSSNIFFAGFASRYAVFFTSPAGGSETPCWVFLFNANTGTFVRGWNTLNGGGPGSLGGGCHAVAIAADRVVIANNGLKNNNPNSLYGGPFETPITGLKRGAAFSSDTALPGLFNGSYDGTCPANLSQQWKDLGATGNNCVTVRIPREPCSAAATASEKANLPCPGDSLRSWVGAPFDEGQDFYDAGRGCDDEHLMVVRRTNLPEGGIEVVLLRDAAPGYCCNAANARGRGCLGSTGQATHATNWSLRMVPRGSCCSCNQVYDPLMGTYLVEEQNLTRGHFAYELLASGNHTFAGIGTSGYVSRYDGPPSTFGQRETARFAQWPRFAGVPSELAGTLQSYIAVGGSAAADFERRFATDWRHPNGSIGLAPEVFGQTIGNPYTAVLQPGTTSVYKANAINGAYDPKRSPLVVWVGRYLLKEKSAPELGNTLTDADLWRFCFAQRNGECRADSTAGDFYAVAPGLDASLTRCHASQISYRSLCAIAGSGLVAQVMQLRIDGDDPAGLEQRRLGYGLTRPGSQYVYSKAKPFPDGKAVLATAWNLEGVYSIPVWMKLPPWPADSVNRTTFVPVQIRSSGDSYIEFGYEEYGDRDQFHCTPRAEACRVSAPEFDERLPFKYASEALPPATGEWTITIPALPGRVLYHRIVTGGQAGPIQAIAIP